MRVSARARINVRVSVSLLGKEEREMVTVTALRGKCMSKSTKGARVTVRVSPDVRASLRARARVKLRFAAGVRVRVGLGVR